MTDSVQPHVLQLTKLFCSWDSSGKNAGMGCHSLLQGIVLTQGSNPGLLHCRQILYHLSHQGSLQEIQKGEEKIEGAKKNQINISGYPGRQHIAHGRAMRYEDFFFF